MTVASRPSEATSNDRVGAIADHLAELQKTVSDSVDGSAAPTPVVEVAAQEPGDPVGVAASSPSTKELTSGPGSEDATGPEPRAGPPAPDVSIWQAQLSVRARNALGQNGVTYLVQLSELTREQVGAFRNLGVKTLSEIESAMANNGIAFARTASPVVRNPGYLAEDGLAADIVARRKLGESVDDLAGSRSLTKADHAGSPRRASSRRTRT